ncbi:uncharacterized protein CLUP02_16050 [Colletotrichum lupini]|uniref:Uncharacterized protein n=1 Tax=Colletotrichum lupini TaxID=145971 RepID=A0A9Q8T823_9PEZI|nr:uncharacterized protein CLUP02_16050 [Colletotrichum lupini]UQC90520.1 hypothetical protein CLUP02_16050 [Colletotrichum lupini]
MHFVYSVVLPQVGDFNRHCTALIRMRVRSHRQPDPPPGRLSVNLRGTRRSYCSFSKFDTSSPSPTTTNFAAGGLPISMPQLLLRQSKGRTSTARSIGVLMKWQKYKCTNETFIRTQQCNGPWHPRLLIEPFLRCQYIVAGRATGHVCITDSTGWSNYGNICGDGSVPAALGTKACPSQISAGWPGYSRRFPFEELCVHAAYRSPKAAVKLYGVPRKDILGGCAELGSLLLGWVQLVDGRTVHLTWPGLSNFWMVWSSPELEGWLGEQALPVETLHVLMLPLINDASTSQIS